LTAVTHHVLIRVHGSGGAESSLLMRVPALQSSAFPAVTPPPSSSSSSQTGAGTVSAPSTIASDERLWAEIMRNIAKDLDVRAHLTLPSVPTILRTTAAKLRAHAQQQKQHQQQQQHAPGSASGAATGALTDAQIGDGVFVAFTCGHVFARRGFFATFLPELEQRLLQVPRAFILFRKSQNQTLVSIKIPPEVVLRILSSSFLLYFDPFV
jgi:hypothetical protein